MDLEKPMTEEGGKLMKEFSAWFAAVSELQNIDDIEAIKYVVMGVMPDLPSKDAMAQEAIHAHD